MRLLFAPRQRFGLFSVRGMLSTAGSLLARPFRAWVADRKDDFFSFFCQFCFACRPKAKAQGRVLAQRQARVRAVASLARDDAGNVGVWFLAGAKEKEKRNRQCARLLWTSLCRDREAKWSASNRNNHHHHANLRVCVGHRPMPFTRIRHTAHSALHLNLGTWPPAT